MIVALTAQNRADFERACTYERVFGSKCLAASRAYGLDGDGARLFVAYADNVPSAALFLRGGILVVSSDNRIFAATLAAFIRETAPPIAEIDTNWEQCAALQALLGGTTDSSYYMEYNGGKFDTDFSAIFAISDASQLPAIFSVLQQSHAYYRSHLRYDEWSSDLLLRLSRGLAELYLLTVDGVASGTCSIASEDECVGVLAAVAVIPAQRGKGYGTLLSQFLVNRILQKAKQPCLISGEDTVAALYRRVGFVENGRWGELYLSISPLKEGSS